MQYLSFGVWLISPSIIFSRISFFCKAEVYAIVCKYHIFLIHSSVDGQLENAVMNTGVQISF